MTDPLDDISYKLGAISGKVDGNGAKLDDVAKQLKDMLDKHDARIGRLEKYAHLYAGAAAAIASAGTHGLSLLGIKFNGS